MSISLPKFKSDKNRGSTTVNPDSYSNFKMGYKAGGYMLNYK